MLDQELSIILFWIHCLNLISTVSENALMLKNVLILNNSKLSQNDDMLRIIDSAFVQTVSLCCLHLLFNLIICVVLHVRKNTDTVLTMTSHSQLLLFSQILRFYRSVLHVESRKLKHRLS